MMFIDYKELTDQEFKIIMPWISVSEKAEYYKYDTLHTGIDIAGTRAYSYCKGVVVAIGIQLDRITVTVQFDASTLFRYGNLRSCDVDLGDVVSAGDRIGTCRDHLHFEYCTSKEQSLFPVRISGSTYFKQNPMPVLLGEVKLKANDYSAVTVADYNDETVPELNPAMQDEFEVDNSDSGDE